jgi:methylated-DNA-[protein]-cysteine S-methyltransferase
MEKLSFDIIGTPWGYVAAALSKHGLRHLVLPLPEKHAAFEALCSQIRDEKLVPDTKPIVFKKLAQQLRHYFQGRPVEFNFKLDYNVATIFQRQVWCVARTIPYGATKTYGWVADKVGDPESRRAVGQALQANPLPLLVPCHRVIASGGKLGGFSADSSTEFKTKLLKMEGAILA